TFAPTSVWLGEQELSRVELEFFAGLSVDHRHRGGSLAKLKLLDREAIEHRVSHLHPLALKQPMHLRETHPRPELVLDEFSVLFAEPASLTFWPCRRSLQCFEDSQKSLVVQPAHTIALRKPHAFGSSHVPPNGFRIRTHRARYRLHPVAAQPLANNFSDFKHRD